MKKSRILFALAGLTIVVSAAIGTVTNVATEDTSQPILHWLKSPVWHAWLALAALVSVAAGLAVAAVNTDAKTRPQPTAADLEAAAMAVRRWLSTQHLGDEIRSRGLNDSDLIPVTWHGTLTRGPGRIEPVQFMMEQGSLRDFLRTFIDDAPQRLLILGPPGSSKTSLTYVLANKLVTSPDTTTPIPMFLNLRDWQLDDSVTSWLKRGILSSLPRTHDPSMVEALFDDGRFLPIVDDFDDTSESIRAAFAHAAESSLLDTDRLVLSTRPSEAALKLAKDWRGFRIEPYPLAQKEITEYLDNRLPTEVVESVKKRLTDYNLAAALNESYWITVLVERLRADPAWISSVDEAHSVDEVHMALHRGFVERLLERQLARHVQERRDVFLHGRIADYDKGIKFLAQHLEASGIRDIYLWQIPSGLQTRDAISVGAAAGVLGTCVSAMLPWPFMLGVISGLGVSIVAAVAIAARAKSFGASVDVKANRTDRRLRLRAKGPLHSIVFSGAAGAMIGLLVRSAMPTDLLGSGVKWLVAILLGAMAGGRVASASWAKMDETYVFSDIAPYASAEAMAKMDRTGTLVFLGSTLTGAAVLTMLTGPFASGLFLGAIGGLVALLVLERFLNGAWLSYVIASLLFASRGRLPWRLTRFLGVLHDAGILRRSAGGFQFRHDSLRRSIVADARRSAT